MSINNPKGHSVSDADVANFLKLPGTFTIATLPTELQANQAGLLAWTSDGKLYVWSGTSWGAAGTAALAGTGLLLSGSTLSIDPSKLTQILFQWGVPVILPSSGSIGNNGALTLTTALQATFANCYMYFPAGAIASGSAAGIYYVQMSSTTAGVIFNNVLASGLPALIASPTAFVTTGPGAYTQSTSSQTLLSLTVPGGTLGANGALRYQIGILMPNNANAKSLLVTLGGTTIQNLSNINNAFGNIQRTIRNIASQAVQIGITTSGSTDVGVSASGPLVTAIDTSTAKTLALAATIGTATDFQVYLGGSIEALYAP